MIFSPNRAARVSKRLKSPSITVGNRLLTRAALFVCFFVAILSIQAQQKISKIVIEHIGPSAASESLARANIRSKEGDEYSRLTLDQDIKNLYGTGLFYNVRAAGQNSPQ